MKRITAVEWLLDNLITEPYSEKDFKHNSECWDKAKIIEKHQIESAYLDGYCNALYNSDSEQYYKENYGKD